MGWWVGGWVCADVLNCVTYSLITPRSSRLNPFIAYLTYIHNCNLVQEKCLSQSDVDVAIISHINSMYRVNLEIFYRG